MKNKESNKSDKKKLFILILLLFVVIGVSGYGAYSYFYTSGSFSGSDTVDIASFDPQVDYSGDFLGHGGTMQLTCPDSELGNETVNCTGTLSVYNNGGTDITVSTSNESADVDPLTSDVVTATAGTPSFSWSNTTITSGSSETLTVTVPVSLSGCFGSSSSCERTEPYDGEAISVSVSFIIRAEQVH